MKRKQLMQALQAKLTPATNYQPRLRGMAQRIIWRPHWTEDTQYNVGVLLDTGPHVYLHVPEKDDIEARFGSDARYLVPLLEAAAIRLGQHDLTPPPGLYYSPPTEAAGDNPAEILGYLWRHAGGDRYKKKVLTQPELSEHSASIPQDAPGVSPDHAAAEPPATPAAAPERNDVAKH